MASDVREISLTIPAKGDYVVLARLALSAVCRLTPLRPDDVADLKLAVTEAAGGVVGSDPARQMSFRYHLEDDRLVLDIEGPGSDLDDDELELGRALVAATVDEHEQADGRVRLVKYLPPVG
jgi:anti-sigma regulatory factor (Ser/Thr protein kinase)